MNAQELQAKLDAMRRRLAARFASLEQTVLAKTKGTKNENEKTADNARRD